MYRAPTSAVLERARDTLERKSPALKQRERGTLIRLDSFGLGHPSKSIVTGFDQILEADVGQVELYAELAFQYGAGESDFGTGAKNHRFGSLLRFGSQISEKRNWPEPD
jgi:hypothetical protein